MATKLAFLFTEAGTEVARVRFTRKEWPEYIVWKKRIFMQAFFSGPGTYMEESSVLHATKVTPRAKYGKEKL